MSSVALGESTHHLLSTQSYLKEEPRIDKLTEAFSRLKISSEVSKRRLSKSEENLFSSKRCTKESDPFIPKNLVVQALNNYLIPEEVSDDKLYNARSIDSRLSSPMERLEGLKKENNKNPRPSQNNRSSSDKVRKRRHSENKRFDTFEAKRPPLFPKK